jgi:hypothetical protein
VDNLAPESLGKRRHLATLALDPNALVFTILRNP